MGRKVIRYDNIITKEERNKISIRYKRITKAINREFFGIDSEIQHSFYVGSYGRATAISTSDIDILIELPSDIFDDVNKLKGNSQSRLLQVVREAIKGTYPNSDVRADGQIIKINFSDGILFEILPAFKNWDGTYTYADTNKGGSWKSTNPKLEQNALREKDKVSNGLLVATCRHIRYIRDNFFKSYNLSGIVIDSFVYHAIGSWRFSEPVENNKNIFTYEQHLFDYFIKNFGYYSANRLIVPGSNAVVELDSSRKCLEKILDYINN